jgi:hypothetical protein
MITLKLTVWGTYSVNRFNMLRVGITAFKVVHCVMVVMVTGGKVS